MLSFLGKRMHDEKRGQQCSRLIWLLSSFWISFLRIVGSEHDEKLTLLEVTVLGHAERLMCVRCLARHLVQSCLVTRSSTSTVPESL